MPQLLPGEIEHVFLISIVDAALVSWIALRWYSRSIERLMRVQADAAELDPPPLAPGDAAVRATSTLGFALFGDAESTAPAPAAASGRVTAAYCTGAAAYALSLTWLAVRAGDGNGTMVQWVALAWTKAWPIVPALGVLGARDWRGGLGIALRYAVLGAVLLAATTVISQASRGVISAAPLTNVLYLFAALAVTAAPAATFLALTAWRRVRAVMPLAIASILMFGAASVLFRELILRAFSRQAWQGAMLALTGSETRYYGLFMGVSLPAGWLAWRFLRAVARGYERKQFSDIQLIVDCWWFVAAADEIATSLALAYGARGIAFGLAAFAAYRITVAVVLGWRRRSPIATGRRLLLLRVFGYRRSTEQLFDRIAQRWRFEGPVHLISGVDLAARTTDPGEVLAFVEGHLPDRYIATRGAIAGRIRQLDTSRDPDGRFRVNELFCHADTWRPAVEALLDVSDGVLMDVRSFSERNAGCIFELQAIVRRIAADRIVLVCDRTTDLRLLGDVLGRAWATAPHAEDGTIAIVHVERQSRRALAVLTRRLLGGGTPQRIVSAAELAGSL